jgi:hypothetical protein
VLLTLVGIRILQQHYGNKQNSWCLIVAKAFNAIMKHFKDLGRPTTKQQVQMMVDSTYVQFSPEEDY